MPFQAINLFAESGKYLRQPEDKVRIQVESLLG